MCKYLILHSSKVKLAKISGVDYGTDSFKKLHKEQKHLVDQNRTLKHRVQNLEQALSSFSEELGMISTLKSQLRIYQEGLLQERCAREKAQAHVLSLKEDINVLKTQVGGS